MGPMLEKSSETYNQFLPGARVMAIPVLILKLRKTRHCSALSQHCNVRKLLPDARVTGDFSDNSRPKPLKKIAEAFVRRQKKPEADRS